MKITLSQVAATALLSIVRDHRYSQNIRADILCVHINLSIEQENRAAITSVGAISLIKDVVEGGDGPQRVN